MPEEVLAAFFGAREVFKPSVLPSAKAAAAVSDLEQLLSRSRPPLQAPRRKRKKQA